MKLHPRAISWEPEHAEDMALVVHVRAEEVERQIRGSCQSFAALLNCFLSFIKFSLDHLFFKIKINSSLIN